MTPGFVSRLSVPPGGYFFELGAERVEARTYDGIVSRARALMAKHGVRGDPAEAVAAFMCPRLGPYARTFCTGEFDASNDVSRQEAIGNSVPLLSRQVETFDRIDRRLARCHACPRHYRGWCLTCTGHYQQLVLGFRGRRPRLPADAVSGVCTCARAYEAALASVVYGSDEKVWEGAPTTCWRYEDV